MTECVIKHFVWCGILLFLWNCLLGVNEQIKGCENTQDDHSFVAVQALIVFLLSVEVHWKVRRVFICMFIISKEMQEDGV